MVVLVVAGQRSPLGGLHMTAAGGSTGDDVAGSSGFL